MSAVPRGTAGAAISITFTILSLLTLIARFYTRIRILKNAGREELAIVTAWAFSTAHTILVCVEIRNGLGGHSADLTIEQQEHILLPFWVSVPLYSISLYITKVSILLLYLRLFPEKQFALACRITIVVMTMFLFWTLFGFMFMCKPVNYFWNKSINGQCMNPKIIYFSNAPFNILTDFVLFGLPLPILGNLQLPRKQKIGLMIVFAFGLLGCLTSILRLRSLYILSISTDLTNDNLDAAIWSCVEANVGIACACVPTLKPLIAAVVPRFLSELSFKSRHTTDIALGQQNKDVTLSQQNHLHSAYAQFDKDCTIPAPWTS